MIYSLVAGFMLLVIGLVLGVIIVFLFFSQNETGITFLIILSIGFLVGVLSAWAGASG